MIIIANGIHRNIGNLEKSGMLILPLILVSQRYLYFTLHLEEDNLGGKAVLNVVNSFQESVKCMSDR